MKSAAFSAQTSENNLNPPSNQFKRQIEGQQWMVHRGSYVHTPVVKLWGGGGGANKSSFLQISQNIDGFRQTNSQDFLNSEIIVNFHYLPKLYFGSIMSALNKYECSTDR